MEEDIFSKMDWKHAVKSFLAMIENISDPDHQGLHLVYSHS